MKTLRLSSVAALLCLLCMGMGFPNLALDDEAVESSSKKKSNRNTCVRTVAMACSRQMKVVQEPTPEVGCLTTKDCKKKAV